MHVHALSLLLALCNMGLCHARTVSYYEIDYSYDSVNIRFEDCWGDCPDLEYGYWRTGPNGDESVPEDSVLVSRMIYVFENQRVYYLAVSSSSIYISLQADDFFSDEQNATMGFEDKRVYLQSILQGFAAQALGIVQDSYDIRCEPESEYQALQDKFQNPEQEETEFISSYDEN